MLLEMFSPVFMEQGEFVLPQQADSSIQCSQVFMEQGEFVLRFDSKRG